MPDPMAALTESVGIRLDRTEKAVAQNTAAIAQLAVRIDGLTGATERLERSVTNLVAGITEPKDAISQMVAQQSEFLKLAQQQTALTQQQSNIIDRLTGQPQRVDALEKAS